MASHRWNNLLGLLAIFTLLYQLNCQISTQETTTNPATTTPSAATTTTPGAPTTTTTASATTTTEKYANQSHGPEYEYPPYDGWYNNLANPSWGGSETILFRRIPPRYGDGSYEPAGSGRPNPIEISDAVMNGSTGMGSHKNRTALLVFFGQQVVEEILDAQRPGCPPEYFNIKIPKGHPQYDTENKGDREMPFLRSRFAQDTGLSPNNPRQQLNEISAFLDGQLIYGPNKAWGDALRTFEDGRLIATNDTEDDADLSDDERKYKDQYFPAVNSIRLPFANPPPPRDQKTVDGKRIPILKPIKRFFKIGNPRGNENPFLLTFGILWFRYHNIVAARLKAKNSNWSDEQLFNEARKWTIAVHQKIVVYDWLPSWLGENGTLDDYKAYDPSINPGIAHVFQSAAMRFGHTLVPPGVYRRDAKCNFRLTSDVTGFAGRKALRTCNVYWNGQESIHESDIDEFLMGMASQIAEREDNIITPDLRGFVFGPLEFTRRDLMAINIQRGRDHGLPDYNTAREQFGLPRITDWDDINRELLNEDLGVFDRLKAVYKDNIDDVDIWVGGLLETTKEGPGPLFQAIIKDQFRRIRDGDRFWFENKLNGLFTDEEIQEIHNTTLYHIILATTNIEENHIQKNVFFHHGNESGDPCEQPAQLDGDNREHLSECTPLQHFDYFQGSEVSFALSFLALGIFLLATIGLLICLAKRRDSQAKKQRAMGRAKTMKRTEKDPTVHTAVEWKGHKAGLQNVRIKVEVGKKQVFVQTEKGKNLRLIDLSIIAKADNTIVIQQSVDKGQRVLAVKLPKEYDLILKFDTESERANFVSFIEKFLGDIGMGNTFRSKGEKDILKEAVTKEDRRKLLDRFFSIIVSQAYDDKKGELSQAGKSSLTSQEAKDIFHCELTKFEFADSLGLKPSSSFVTYMFDVIDKDNNGYISFTEFLDCMVIFSKGDVEAKATLLFDMYDLDKNRKLSKEEFKRMLQSFLEASNDELQEETITELIQGMFQRPELKNSQEITLDDFKAILSRYDDVVKNSFLPVAGQGKERKRVSQARDSYIKENLGVPGIDEMRDTSLARLSRVDLDVTTIEKKPPKGKFEERLVAIKRYIENYKRQIFIVTLYTLVTAGVFIERAYYYSVEREHAGLRRIAGYGVTVTRGAASGMMFTYSCILVTMCRNTITFLRETVFHRYIPFDSAVAFHKYIAYLALFFTVMHCVGHGINFYHISTQTANDLICLFRNFFHTTDTLPKFHRWCFDTLTGFTGVLLTLLVIVMYTFALQYARRHVFRAFWITHNMYIILFFLMVLHGAGRLVQPPFTHYFLLGPLVLFTIDKLISISRKKVEIAVVKAELLPSDVTHLQFKRPANFEYKSGQWVRIACLVQGKSEYHPFTLTSAPHEENLSLHIRAVGPWTTNLRKTYSPNTIREQSLPKIYLDGPYGEGHQDWYKYDVAVLVGGGIGVTPFASILKDIAHKGREGGAKIQCKKVYFLWVTRTQKQFEWMTEIIKEVEKYDKGLVSVHIFITQFKEKYDFRTSMLYICERYFHKILNRSLFTGLQSITHFGRPDFNTFFKSLMKFHAETNLFGVFSCGPPPMTNGIDKSCNQVNNQQDNALFVHHFENF